ncbi:MAG: HAMP domain-containing protein [Archangiaceae bacterium]|nr:HAMP domain-containing protein [Archangiaceae bacterium]
MYLQIAGKTLKPPVETALSIRTKLIALIFAGVLVPLGAALAYSTWQEVHTLRRDLVSESLLIGRIVSDYSASALNFEDQHSAEESLRSLSKHQDLLFGALYDASGARFAEWHSGASAEPPVRLDANAPAIDLSDPYLDTVHPVVRADTRYGTLYLRASTASLSARTRRYLWNVAGLGLGMAVFAFAFAFALRRVVSLPITRLSDATRQVTRNNDYSVRVQKLSDDEIGQLSDDFNTMVAEIARTQNELVRKERLAAVGELSAVMAHEVRNALGVVFNSLEALRRRSAPEAPEVRSLLDMVGEEADRLNRIVEDLLDFARPNPPRREATAIEQVIASAVEVASCTVPPARFRIATEVDPGLPPLQIDERMIRQALINLLINALQAMPTGGSVTVRANPARVEGRAFAQVEVSDDGPGMTSEVEARLFQPFFTTKATGTGLGLAVVRRFVEAHSGQVTVRSKKGDGSTFIMMLPLDVRALQSVS